MSETWLPPLVNPLNPTLQSQSPLVDPRFHLPQDILWYTFFFVVQPPINRTRNSEHSGLNDLRHLSQVCASWRELLLASSSLWGMAFELDQLLQNTCHWRNEVLRRTGNALLDIRCHISAENIGVLDQIFKSLLDDHWPRIRRLDVKFNEFTLTAKGEKILQEAISAFRKPAINLKSFAVDLGKYSRDIFITPSLFADQAPVLQEFTGCSFRIDPHRPWFSNLRVLRIACIWTAHEVLDTVASMPLLEILEFNEDDRGNEAVLDPPVVGSDRLPRAVLPHLKELIVHLGTALAKYVAVLERLVPAPGLRFALISSQLPFAADLIPVQHVLRSYLQLSFKNELPHDLQIIMDRDYILVYLSKDSRKVTFEFEFDDDVPDMSSIFLDPVSLISLKNSTKLSININGAAFAVSNTALSRILLSSASIKKLHTSAYSLQFLLSLSLSADTILFPILELLRLDGPHKPGLVLDFLSRRYTQEAPIQALDFGQYQRVGSCDFQFLEQFNGLRVCWKGNGGSTEEYTCGSGNAQVLDFTQNLPEP